MLADPPKCPQCGCTENLKLLGKLKDRARFRGVARLFGYHCPCGATFKHSILNNACERLSLAPLPHQPSSSAA
jgi:hypothetical protein